MNDEDLEWYRQLLGTNTDEFYQAKFRHGEVIADWSYARWTLERTAAWVKRPSKGCNVVRYQ